MLGSDRSRGYCLEMICADFLAGANLENGDPELLLLALRRLFRFLTSEQLRQLLQELATDVDASEAAESMSRARSLPAADPEHTAA